MLSVEVIVMNKAKPVLAFLESAWLNQLSSEFESLCYQYRLKLHKPVFEIREMKSQWGQWDPLTRTLSISRLLIQQHSWQHVLGVFKHELAHMIVTDIFSGDSTHGPDFQKACGLLGVPEEYRGAGLDLGEPLRTWQESVHVPEEDAVILRKVEKLLAMAESNNENEAFLAMARVQELIHKYNLDRVVSRRKSRYVSLIVNHRKQKVDRLQRMIAGILTGYYFVDIVFSDLYDAHENTVHKTMEILGTDQNVLMAEYVYNFLRQQSESLWDQYRQQKSLKGHAPKMSFQTGVVSGFKRKLDQLEKSKSKAASRVPSAAPDAGVWQASEASSTALMKFNDPGLRQFVSSRFPRLTSVRSGGRVLGEHYDQGKAQGERIVIHKGISSNGGRSGALLGPSRG
ncbi:MAG: hypothetical protein RIR26_314 [Pseudomonadota bacterium]|jgi:hypothetical protein